LLTILAMVALLKSVLFVAAVGGTEALRRHSQHKSNVSDADVTTGDYLVFHSIFTSNDDIGKYLISSSEILVCPRSGFSADDQKFLNTGLANFSGGFKLDDAWRKSRSNTCDLLRFATFGGKSKESCSGLRASELKISARGYKGTRNRMYFRGSSEWSGKGLMQEMCKGSCGENWAQAKWGLLTNDHTLAATAFTCMLRMSDKKPSLGPLSTGWTPKCSSCPTRQ